MLIDGVACVPHALCILRWPSNFSKSSLEIAQVVETIFSLREGPWALDFITEESLKAFRFALDESLQVDPIVGSSTIVAPFATVTALDAVASPIGCFWCCLVYCFAFYFAQHFYLLSPFANWWFSCCSGFQRSSYFKGSWLSPL